MLYWTLEKREPWLCSVRDSATLSPVVTWKVENISNLAKESLSKQSVEGAASFFLLLMHMCDERNKLHEGMSNISEPGLAGFNKS